MAKKVDLSPDRGLAWPAGGRRKPVGIHAAMIANVLHRAIGRILEFLPLGLLHADLLRRREMRTSVRFGLPPANDLILLRLLRRGHARDAQTQARGNHWNSHRTSLYTH